MMDCFASLEMKFYSKINYIKAEIKAINSKVESMETFMTDIEERVKEEHEKTISNV